MSQPTNIQDYVPAIRTGAGLPFTFILRDSGQGVTSNATTLDSFIVPHGLVNDNKGVRLRVLSMVCRIASLGTGASSGTWDVKLMNGSTVVGKASLVYNASGAALAANIDLRDASGKGVEFKLGDVLSLDLDVEAGSLSGGAKGIQCTVICEVYGSKG